MKMINLICLKLHLFSFLTIIFLISYNSAYSQEINKSLSDSCYTVGINAYQNKNYSEALKYLFAYKMLILEKINRKENKDFLNKIDAKLLDCQKQLLNLEAENSKLRKDLLNCKNRLNKYQEIQVSSEKTNEKIK